MSVVRVFMVVVVAAAGSFAVGRVTAEPAALVVSRPAPAVTVISPRAEPDPEPVASPGGAAGQILANLAQLPEDQLPRRGVLGGTMVAGTVALPKGFEGRPGERFYVVGGDGHIIVTWSYEMRRGGGWRFLGEEDGYVPVDFERHLEKFDVFYWRPAYYVVAPQAN